MPVIRFLSLLLIPLTIASLWATEPEPVPRVHFIVGPSNHAPGTHEVGASARLLKYCLDEAKPGVTLQTAIHEGWPQDPKVLDGARVIVFCGDQFPPVRFANSIENLAQVSKLADQGCSFVAIHYAIGINRPYADSIPIQATMGRLFGGFSHFIPVEEGGTVPRVLQATIVPSDTGHPVVRGVDTFSLRDEPYYKNRFPTPSTGVRFTTLATAMVPPEAPREEIVAWSIERENCGRGVAIVMPHFYANWHNDDLRKLILNGIVWAAGEEIPDGGIPSTLRDLATFKPESVEPIPSKP